MPVTVVVGGQFGSEGKGKVAHFLAKEMGATVAIRVGGPNSGHTVIDSEGKPIIFKQLPTAALLPNVQCVLPAGSYIRTDILLEEVRIARLDPERLLIDPSAVVITERELAEERGSELHCSIGSTQSGTGSAVIARTRRTGPIKLARDEELLQPYVRPAVPFLRERLNKKERVLIEGTQGFGLSVLHSPHYPFATSRDTTAAGFIAEAGLSPLDVDDVVLVLRAFPIRVHGNSGPLVNEMSWEDVTRESNSQTPIFETTTVTHRLRRVGRFDAGIVRVAIACNRPTRIILNHLDYIDSDFRDATELSGRAELFVRRIKQDIRQEINYVGFGPASVIGNQARRGQLVSQRVYDV
jgi:adenylosuccinate synthase